MNFKSSFLFLAGITLTGCGVSTAGNTVCPGIISYTAEEQQTLLNEKHKASPVIVKVINEDYGFRSWARKLGCPETRK